MKHSIQRWVVAAAAAAMMAACSAGPDSEGGTSGFGNGAGITPGGTTSVQTPSTGGTTVVTPIASDMVLVMSKASVPNTGTDVTTATVTVLDANRNAVKGVKVVFTADSDAIVTPKGTETGDDGTIQADISIGANRKNRVITVQATAGGVNNTPTVSKSTPVAVYGAKITSTMVTSIVQPGSPGRVQFRLVDNVGNAMPNEDYTVTATGMTPATATGKTDFSGNFQFDFAAPTAAGNYEITAAAAGTTTAPALVLQVQGVTAVPDAVGDILSASIDISPNVVKVNQIGSTANRSQVRVQFLGVNNRPIPNVRVRFDLGNAAGVIDPNSLGGAFTAGGDGTKLYSDANGVVMTEFIAGNRSGPTDGAWIRACYEKTDTADFQTVCTYHTQKSLTVTGSPLGVSIGTGNYLGMSELAYTKRFLVSVVDSAGNAVPDVSVSASLYLARYGKGFFTYNGNRWVPDPATHWCDNEDKPNKNGVLEVGEDINGNGRLEPGKSDVTLRLIHNKTRADGTAEVELTYAKSFGTWLKTEITVAATGVSGSEGRSTFVWFTEYGQDDAKSELFPSFGASPYGIVKNCADPN